MLRFFDDVEGNVRCTFFKLQPVRKADAESLFQALDSNFSDDGTVRYANLVGLDLMVQMLCSVLVTPC